MSGMTDSRRTGGFFDIRRVKYGTWDPTLAIVFFTGLSVNTFLYHFLVKRMKRPLNATKFQLPTKTNVDTHLILGSALFGIGWAITGGCPGPLIISASTGYSGSLVALSGAILGTGLQRLKSGNQRAFLVSMLTAGCVLAAARLDSFSIGTLIQDKSATEPLYKLGAFGGILIGISAALFAIIEGKVLGISGIIGGLLTFNINDTPKRLAFLGGMIAASITLGAAIPNHVIPSSTGSTLTTLVAGILIGFGTSMGNGCTSGHGICGMARFSRRSIVAVLTFMSFNTIISSIIP